MTAVDAAKTSRAETVVVLVAMAAEASPFLADASGAGQPATLECPLADAAATRIRLDGRDVVLITTGIGLVAAGSAATWAALTFNPRAMISAGTAGGLAPASRVGDVAIGLDYTYGTADATEFGYERGQVPRQPVRFAADPELVRAAGGEGMHPGNRIDDATPARLYGRILSGDTFVTARNVADTREAFADAVATDMESCAIAQACRSLGVPFISVRGISDLCGPEAGIDHHLSVDATSRVSADAVRELLRQLA